MVIKHIVRTVYRATHLPPAGDLVAAVAQPIAKRVDAATRTLPAALHTNIQGCGACGKRHEVLNDWTK